MTGPVPRLTFVPERDFSAALAWRLAIPAFLLFLMITASLPCDARQGTIADPTQTPTRAADSIPTDAVAANASLLRLGLEPRTVVLQHVLEMAEEPEGNRVGGRGSGTAEPVGAVLARLLPGRTIRMHLRSGRKLEGQYERSQDGRVILADPAMTPVAHSDVDTLWVRVVSKNSGALTGEVIGALAGAGFFIYVASGLPLQGNDEAGALVAFGISGAVCGGFAGALLGAVMSSGSVAWFEIFPSKAFAPTHWSFPTSP